MRQKYPSDGSDSAESHVIAEILFVAVVVTVAAIFAALLYGMIPHYIEPSKIPEILAIVEINHKEKNGQMTYASVVKLLHKGTTPLFNDEYSAEIYVNDVKQYVFISTLDGGKFIPTHHYGVATVSGTGVIGYRWKPGEFAWFNLRNELIVPGDIVQIDILRKSDGAIISRSIATAP